MASITIAVTEYRDLSVEPLIVITTGTGRKLNKSLFVVVAILTQGY